MNACDRLARFIRDYDPDYPMTDEVKEQFLGLRADANRELDSIDEWLRQRVEESRRPMSDEEKKKHWDLMYHPD